MSTHPQHTPLTLDEEQVRTTSDLTDSGQVGSSSHLSDSGHLPAPAVWHAHCLNAWRREQDQHADLADLRQGLRAALDLIRDRDRRIKSLENTNAHLLAQLQAAFSGRTVAAERQAIERELVDRDTEERFANRHRRGAA